MSSKFTQMLFKHEFDQKIFKQQFGVQMTDNSCYRKKAEYNPKRDLFLKVD